MREAGAPAAKGPDLGPLRGPAGAGAAPLPRPAQDSAELAFPLGTTLIVYKCLSVFLPTPRLGVPLE